MKWILILLLAVPAIADQDIEKVPAPRLQKNVGDQAATGTYAKCVVSAGDTRTSQVVDGDEGDFTSKKNKHTQKDLENLIRGAAKETKMNRALHIREEVPNVVITATISWEIKEFKLLVDASDLTTRVGPNSNKLIEIANQECGKLKPLAEKREK